MHLEKNTIFLKNKYFFELQEKLLVFNNIFKQSLVKLFNFCSIRFIDTSMYFNVYIGYCSISRIQRLVSLASYIEKDVKNFNGNCFLETYETFGQYKL